MTLQTQPSAGSPPMTINIEDPSVVLPYLNTNHLIQPGDHPSVTVLSGGVSSRTVLVEAPGRPSFVLKQALAKLRVASDWFSSPDRIHREALGMRWLRNLAPPGAITSLLFEDTSNYVIAMSAVPQPHRNWKKMLFVEPPVRSHVEQFALILSQIHSKSHADSSLVLIFGDQTNFESLRLEPYYRYSAECVPEAGNFLRQLIEDTADRKLSLVHGDYSPKNILVHEDKLVLVDHEVVHFGDPAFDVGFSLTHLLSKALHRNSSRQEFLAAAQLFVNQYLQGVRAAGFDLDLESRACRHALACLLARVAGRSPFEYLTAEERAWQKRTTLNLMLRPASRLSELIQQFTEELKCPRFTS